MYELGRPGEFVTGQKWRRLGAALLFLAAACALATAAVAGGAGTAYAGSPPLRALCFAGTVAAAVGCWYVWVRAARAWRRARQAAVGARSEREARAAIRRTGSIAAAYGLVLGRTGDCDAVVVTRGCGAAAIEVKTGHGEVHVADGTMWAGGRALHKSPTRQAAGQARRLSRLLDHRPVLAVVCVPGMRNRAFTTADGVWVCAARDLSAVLEHAPRIFGSADDARRTLGRLWRSGSGSGGVRVPDDR